MVPSLDKNAAAALAAKCEQELNEFAAKKIAIDITRGKPCKEQLDLSAGMEQGPIPSVKSEEGHDVRNYGVLEGLLEARRLVAPILGVTPEETIVHGTSSLSLMYHTMAHAHLFGVDGKGSAWNASGTPVKFICVVPGYDRHFTVTQQLGIEMIPVELKDGDPDMDEIEALVRKDPSIKGIWCVPKYSNPTGDTYSDAAVARLAKLGKIAGPNFRIMWDNAYEVHDLYDETDNLANIMELCRKEGTEDSVMLFGSMSKITFAGTGISFMASSKKNVKSFLAYLNISIIGPDKVNQMRHVAFFKDHTAVRAHMKKHAAILRPKFEIVEKTLSEGLGNSGFACWTRPKGGYFVSLDTLPGLAKEVVAICAKAGVKLTPAGATYPYGKDPKDSNIRIAPSFCEMKELEPAIKVLVSAVKLATARKFVEKGNGTTTFASL